MRIERSMFVRVPWSLLDDPNPKETLERLSGWIWPDEQVQEALEKLGAAKAAL